MRVEDAMGLWIFPSSHEALDRGQNTLVLHTKSTQVLVKNRSLLETTFTSPTLPFDLLHVEMQLNDRSAADDNGFALNCDVNIRLRI